MSEDMQAIFGEPIVRGTVYQSNTLIEAQKDFNLTGMRIFILGLQGLNPHFSPCDKFFDEEFKELFIPTAKLAEMFGNTWHLHKISEACTKLFNATIEIGQVGGTVLSHLFRKLEYVPGEGLYICFDDLLKPYLLNLSESHGYTRIDANQIFNLSSTYAIRLLELLLQYQNVKEFRLRQEITREIKLDRLRFFLNVPEGAYAGRLNNFRRFVLDGPIQEINSCSVYSIRYRTIKEGRKVIGFEFKLDISRVPLSVSDVRNPKFQNDAIEALKALGFTEQVSRAIFAKCLDAADCFSRINRAQALLDRSKTPIKNRAGFLRRAIEDDWRVQGGKLGRKKSPKVTGFMSLSEIFDPVLKALRTPKPAPKSGEATPSVKKNKYNLPENLVQNLTEWLENEMSLETAQIVLSSYNLTLEQFREEFLRK